MKISKPKLSPARVENKKSSHPALSRVFRQSNDHRGNEWWDKNGNEWWDKNEEEVLFGVEPNTANISQNKSLAPKSCRILTMMYPVNLLRNWGASC